MMARRFQPIIAINSTTFTLPKVRREMAANYRMVMERRRRSVEDYNILTQSSENIFDVGESAINFAPTV